MFDVEQAKKQVDAVPTLALPYFLDACDEVERLRTLLLKHYLDPNESVLDNTPDESDRQIMEMEC